MGPWEPSAKRFEMGTQLVRMSLESMGPELLDRSIVTKEELAQAMDSLEAAATPKRQLLSMPGGHVFQWWAQKQDEDVNA